MSAKTAKTLAFLAISISVIALTGCNNTKAPQTTTEAPETEIQEREPGTIVLDFPVTTLEAQKDQWALAPSKENFDNFIKEKANVALIFQAVQIVEVKDAESKVKDLLETEYEIPNSLIIPLGEMQEAKDPEAETGEIVLTFWQSGGEMMRALVTEGGLEPQVRYLSPGAPSDNADTLKQNSFTILEPELTPGITVTYESEYETHYGILITQNEDQALVQTFNKKVKIFNKKDLNPIEPTTKIDNGDKIMAPVTGKYREVIITEVFPENGQLIAEFEFSGQKTQKTFFITDITKNL